MSPCPYPVYLTNTSMATIAFNDSFDLSNIFWTWEELDGWFSTDVKSSLLDPAAGVGQVVGELRRSSKPIILKGFAGVRDGDTWWTAANALEYMVDSMASAATPGILQVDEPTPKQISVYSNGRVQMGRKGVLRAATGADIVAGFVFQIPLIAPSPIKEVVTP